MSRLRRRLLSVHHMKPTIALVAHVLCACACAILGQPDFGKAYEGDGTFYTLQGVGACGLEKTNAQKLPWSTGIKNNVAMNDPQFANSASCGLCLTYRGTGAGVGQTLIADTPQSALVTDLCPECLTGSLDMAMPGDGRFKIQWTPAQCDVGSTGFVYSLEGSNNFYIKLRITNTRVPIQEVFIQTPDQAFVPMKRSADNAWILGSAAPLVFPVGISVVSILGDRVLDSLEVTDPSNTSPIQGKAQFPINSAAPIIGTANASIQSVTASAESPTTAQLAPEAAPTGAEAPAACTTIVDIYKQCGGFNEEADAPTSGHCCTSGTNCTRVNAYWWGCFPVTNPNPKSSGESSQIPPYSSCGGLAYNEDFSADASDPSVSCTAGYVCTRHSPQVWTCDAIPVQKCAG